jgi:hypothetical protein
MPQYVDGFIVPVPKKNVDSYRRLAQKADIIAQHPSSRTEQCERHVSSAPIRDCVGWTRFTRSRRVSLRSTSGMTGAYGARPGGSDTYSSTSTSKPP